MIPYRFLIIIIFQLALVSCGTKKSETIVCGDDQVIIFDNETSDKENVNILWNWQAPDATDLPSHYQKYLISIDECKPVNNNKEILITSSSGAVVLIDRETKKSLFYAHVPNAHSAELLPGNRVIVALSLSPDGNSPQLYDLSKSEKIIFKDSLYFAHGVIWMKKTKSLFALGYDVLRRYSLKDWKSEKPVLHLEKTWTLPDIEGHDLNRISSKKLIITTINGVWIFDISEEKFYPFHLLDGVKNVKSVNYSESDKKLIYTKGEISWWTHNIYFKNPDKTVKFPEIRLYKARPVPRAHTTSLY